MAQIDTSVREFDVEQPGWQPGQAVIPIQPTSTTNGVHTDTALAGLLNLYGTQIASFRQVIWSRFNIMLLFNSLLLAALTGPATGLAAWRHSVPVVGMIVCGLWAIMLGSDLWLMVRLVRAADRFRSTTTTVPASANFFSELQHGQQGIISLVMLLRWCRRHEGSSIEGELAWDQAVQREAKHLLPSDLIW